MTNNSNKIALVDFGIMGSLNEFDQRYLAENCAAFERDYRRVAELHVESGWVPEATRVDEFEFAIRSVCEPILDRPASEISIGNVLLVYFKQHNVLIWRFFLKCCYYRRLWLASRV